MNAEQIEKYEMCKSHLESIEKYKKELPFGHQKYGCGSNRPYFEFTMEKIHNEMYDSVTDAINKAKKSVQNILDNI